MGRNEPTALSFRFSVRFPKPRNRTVVINMPESRSESANVMSTTPRGLVPALLASGIILITLAIYYWPMLSTGEIRQWDEYHTLERSGAMIEKGDWLAVHENQRPTFKKPPLQYWLTATVMLHTENLTFALRLWPYLFSLMLLMSVGLLAYALQPATPYAIPASMLLMSGSLLLWRSGISAMLDAGAAFFLTLGVAASILALRNPRWWYIVALAVGLGALQKAPVGLLAAGLILLLVPLSKKWHDISLRAIWRSWHFRFSALLMAALVASWPLLQILRFGAGPVQRVYRREMLERFQPTADVSEIGLQWLESLLRDGAGLWIPALLSVVLLPFVNRKPEALIPFVLFAAFAIAMTLASGKTYDRYLLQILPILAAVLAVVLSRAVRNGFALTGAALAITLWAGAPFQTVESLKLDHSRQALYRPFLQEFAESARDGETLVRCGWGGMSTSGYIVPGAYHHYASKGRVFHTIRHPEALKRLSFAPYRGICRADQFDELTQHWAGLRIVSEFGRMVHWVSDRPTEQAW